MKKNLKAIVSIILVLGLLVCLTGCGEIDMKQEAIDEFNTTAAAKSGPVEITVWDWVGDMRYLRVPDAAGNDLPFQRIDVGLQHYWDHKFFRFLVRVALPAFSYATVVLRPRAMES